PESRFYCNGGWLENHVFSLLFGMRKNRPQLADIARGVTIVRNQGKVKNELDVAAICHNRLHIIECKTRRFGSSKADKSAANSAIYRLDTIKSISGGHSGRAMLISYQQLNKYTLSRAKDLGIYCCSHTQLKQLERHLYQFIDQQSDH
ncbi:MAG: Card1-like endonuclease domain-containing protein, partial [Marinicella sp.]